ncbi:MAG: hypothetical protein M1816_001555 [Peltula sp. TS41687]|nr:MAG: hypothetical protein M1816_001555 [Peltula sp. TS41687]
MRATPPLQPARGQGARHQNDGGPAPGQDRQSPERCSVTGPNMGFSGAAKASRTDRAASTATLYDDKKKKWVRRKQRPPPPPPLQPSQPQQRPLMYDDRRRRWTEDKHAPLSPDLPAGMPAQVVKANDDHALQMAIHVDGWRDDIWTLRKNAAQAVAGSWDEWHARFVDLTSPEEIKWRIWRLDLLAKEPGCFDLYVS